MKLWAFDVATDILVIHSVRVASHSPQHPTDLTKTKTTRSAHILWSYKYHHNTMFILLCLRPQHECPVSKYKRTTFCMIFINFLIEGYWSAQRIINGYNFCLFIFGKWARYWSLQLLKSSFQRFNWLSQLCVGDSTHEIRPVRIKADIHCDNHSSLAYFSAV